MTEHDASTIAHIQKKVEKLMREGEELRQMKLDAEFLGKFREIILHEPYD